MRIAVFSQEESSMSGYAEVYRRSLEKPEEFWAEAAEAIDWSPIWTPGEILHWPRARMRRNPTL